MGKWIFAAILIVALAAYLIIRYKVKRYSRALFGTDNIEDIITDLNNDIDDKPRSLSGCDTLYRPKILKDFPDYDFTLGETYVKEHLTKQLEGKDELKFHNVVIKNYERSSVQKTIIYQASLEYRENGKLTQKRYELNYSYIIPTKDDSSVASNCPNCGGVIKYGEVTCPFCGSRVVNVFGNCWEFTETFEN